MLLERFPVSVGVVAGVVIAITSIFVLSMPMYRSPIDRAMLAPAVHGHTAAQVKHTFRIYGVRLRYASHADGVTTLGVTPPPWSDASLYVTVERDGTVRTHYGGGSDRVRAWVRAAAAALSR